VDGDARELGGDVWRTLDKMPLNAKDGKVEFSTSRVWQNMCFVKLEARKTAFSSPKAAAKSRSRRTGLERLSGFHVA